VRRVGSPSLVLLLTAALLATTSCFATISCGRRIDGFFSRRVILTDNSGGTVAVEIRCSLRRTLNKVCSVQGENPILVTDSYEFESKENIDESQIKWSFEWSKSQNLQVAGGPENMIGKRPQLTYTIKAVPNSVAGTASLQVPVTVECLQQAGTITKILNGDLPVHVSPIAIGVSDVKRGAIISDAMIRSVESRKYVATFPWFAWLSEVLEEDGLPWSGDVSVHCAAERFIPGRSIKEATMPLPGLKRVLKEEFTSRL